MVEDQARKVFLKGRLSIEFDIVGNTLLGGDCSIMLAQKEEENASRQDKHTEA